MGPFCSRRGRDLNPRESFKPPTRLAGERLRPLGHLSGSAGQAGDARLSEAEWGVSVNLRYRSIGGQEPTLNTDDMGADFAEDLDESVEPPTRGKAWMQIVLVSLGIFVVGTSLLVVLWLLFTSTLALIQAVI